MRLSYAKPHMVAAVRAVRYVAGEMRRARLLGARDEGLLLHILGSSPVDLPVPVPVERPSFVRRPSAGGGSWREDEVAWLAAADDFPRQEFGDYFVVAELTLYRRRVFQREFTLEQLRITSRDPIEGPKS